MKNGRAPTMKNVKAFQLPDLQRMVSEAGFEDFKPEPFGCLLLFTMKRN